MAGHGEKLSRKREQAIAALLAQPTIAKAAEACGVGERTLHRWLADPDFAQRYAVARRDVLRQGIGRLVGALPRAVQVLDEVMTASDAPAAVRVSAARVVVSGWQAAHDADDLEERIAALEQALRRGVPS